MAKDAAMGFGPGVLRVAESSRFYPDCPKKRDSLPFMTGTNRTVLDPFSVLTLCSFLLIMESPNGNG